MKKARKRLTYANVMSSLAVFLVLGGASAVAATQLGKNTVGTKQLKANAVTGAKIKKNAVTGAKIKKNAITGAKIKNNAVTGEKIANGAVTGAKVNASTLGTVPKATSAESANTAKTASSANALAGYSRRGQVRVEPTAGVTKEAAEAAAPEASLFSAGPFTVYAKCLATPTTVYGVLYIKTSQGGAIMDSDEDEFDGEPFLEPNTKEEERELAYESVSANSADYYGEHSPEFAAMAPDGTAVRGELQVAVKNGELVGGNGVYGPGSVCLFAGDLTTLNG